MGLHIRRKFKNLAFSISSGQSNKKRMAIMFTSLAVCAGIFGAFSSGVPANAASHRITAANDTGTIVIGGKNFTESQIMADMLQLLVQHYTHLTVQTKTWLDSSVTWSAMHAGQIDVYVEYTGTGLVNILHQPTNTNPNFVYKKVKRLFQKDYQVTWLKPIGFNDTYAMVMRKSEANRLHIHTLSQLAAKSGQLTLGSDTDFMFRADTLPALNRVYHTHFKNIVTLSIGLKYQALEAKKIDVTDGFSTDGQIPELHLVVLKDNKHVFPPYYAAPIIRDSVLKAHPELAGIFNKLAGKINDIEMQKMNAAVDIHHENAMIVAKNFLVAHHII